MADVASSALHIGDDLKGVSTTACVCEQLPEPAPSTAAPGLSTPPAVLAAPQCSDAQPGRPHSVGIIYCAVTELHALADHAECPARTISIKAKLQQESLLDQCTQLVPREATTEELLLAHTAAHIRKIDELYRPGVTLDVTGELAEQDGDALIISGDIYCTQHTSRAARAAAGCAIQAVQQVLAGAVQHAFAVVRPPGHHAESDGAMGFCLYNNVAVAARSALQCPGIQRVLILDWDVHHGNGSQQIFESDPRVLVISLHRRDSGFYPVGVGYASEVGSGPGAGFNVNVPWAAKGVGDADFMAAFELLVMPIAASFDPQLVLVSAGFDAAEGDPLGQCKASPEGFGHMAQQLMGLAGGKVVCVLEGGYNTRVISECAAEVVRVLLGQAPGPMAGKTASRLHKTTPAMLTEVHKIQQEFWPVLRSATPIEQQVEQFSAALQLQALSLRSGGRTPANRHSAADALADELGGLSMAEEGGRVVRPKPVLSSAAKRAPSARQAAAAAAAAVNAAAAAAAANAAAAAAAASKAATKRASPLAARAASNPATLVHASASGTAPSVGQEAAQPLGTWAAAPAFTTFSGAWAPAAASAAPTPVAASMVGSSEPGTSAAAGPAAPAAAMATTPPAATVPGVSHPFGSHAPATGDDAAVGATQWPASTDSAAASTSNGMAASSPTSAPGIIGNASATGAAASGMPATSSPASAPSCGPAPDAAGIRVAGSGTAVVSGAPDQRAAAAGGAFGNGSGASEMPVDSKAGSASTSVMPALATGAAAAAGAAISAVGTAAAGLAGAVAAAAGAVGAAVGAVGSAAAAGAAAVVERSPNASSADGGSDSGPVQP